MSLLAFSDINFWLGFEVNVKSTDPVVCMDLIEIKLSNVIVLSSVDIKFATFSWYFPCVPKL